MPNHPSSPRRRFPGRRDSPFRQHPSNSTLISLRCDELPVFLSILAVGRGNSIDPTAAHEDEAIFAFRTARKYYTSNQDPHTNTCNHQGEQPTINRGLCGCSVQSTSAFDPLLQRTPTNPIHDSLHRGYYLLSNRLNTRSRSISSTRLLLIRLAATKKLALHIPTIYPPYTHQTLFTSLETRDSSHAARLFPAVLGIRSQYGYPPSRRFYPDSILSVRGNPSRGLMLSANMACGLTFRGNLLGKHIATGFQSSLREPVCPCGPYVIIKIYSVSP